MADALIEWLCQCFVVRFMAHDKNLWEILKNDKTLPTGFTKAASLGNTITLSPLLSKNIISVPAISMGREFLGSYMINLRKNVCEGSNCIYEQFKECLVATDILKPLIKVILTVGFSAALFWYPIAIYLALLIIKTGLDVYCKGEPHANGLEQVPVNQGI